MNEATRNMTQLRLERRYAAPPEAVFEAWTSPQVLRRWWAAGPDWETPVAEVDLRAGGRYRLTMRDPGSGDLHTVGGEYLEVTPPRRVSYTWTWEAPDKDESSAGSVVTVEFSEDDGGTKVVLVHSGISDETSRDQHSHGWVACMDNLGSRVLEAGVRP